MAFDPPSGDFTPFGYLRNPGHWATSWQHTGGGNLRTAADRPGVEWAYPVGRDPTSRVGLGFETVVDGRPCRTRADFDAIGLTSRYHSCLIFGFDWQIDGVQIEARFFLANDDALCARLNVANRASDPRQVQVSLCAWKDRDSLARPDPSAPWLLTETPAPHVILYSPNGVGVDAEMAPGAVLRQLAMLARGPQVDAAVATGSAALGQAEASYARLLAEDAEFYASCPTLSGDWPAGWREGLVYDFETTRLLVQPAGGIFGDVWPSWMAAWPRVVLAEGTLDMLRLAYADPALAKRAVLSMFRDAPQPNVPCVFRDGEFNMVAADGSRCGTSPAWCLPFLSLELLYLRTLDRQWLRQLYPYACAFIDWWLEHRVDADGWVVYKCTWESGEDGNPRLDPTGSGDADISGRVRPVELQATLAQAAGVLAFFAAELELTGDVPRWRRVEAAYRDRARQLFDAQAGRFRDWLVAEEQTQPALRSPHPRPLPQAEGDQGVLYWGIDPHRYSVQSLTPLLIGEPLAPAESLRYACPPWTLWPSWIITFVESGAAAGLFAAIGTLAFETIDRVYRMTTRRELGSLSRPLPGCAPEFWPTDWRTYDGSDAYGWGATTANLLIRHLFGFKESRQTNGWSVDLTPALPEALLEAGLRYGIRNVNYRGLVFDLTYAVTPDSRLVAEIDLGSRARECYVNRADDSGERVYASPRASSRHEFPLQVGRAFTLRLS
jgi:hypothetical protein